MLILLERLHSLAVPFVLRQQLCRSSVEAAAAVVCSNNRTTVVASAASVTHAREGGITKCSSSNSTRGYHVSPFLKQRQNPRQALALGLDAARHTSNILRLLEASHGSAYTGVDTLETVYHPQSSQRWKYAAPDLYGGKAEPLWGAVSIMPSSGHHGIGFRIYHGGSSTSRDLQQQQQQPRLHSLAFSDDRTALVKLTGVDGIIRYLSLLRLDGGSNDGNDETPYHHDHGGAYYMSSAPAFGPSKSGTTNRLMNDGWTILREVLWNSPATTTTKTNDDTSSTDLTTSLLQTLHDYLRIEHGGGPDDAQRAAQLFHHQACLLSVGLDNSSETTTNKEKVNEWSAPAGRLIQVSRETYLQCVAEQTPHNPAAAAAAHDAMVSVDWSLLGASADGMAMSSRHPAAVAAATVRVGNGAQTRIFEDHLLLARDGSSDNNDDEPRQWQILSKTFSAQAWPES